MSAKTDFQNNFNIAGGQFAKNTGVAELAGYVWDALNGGDIESVAANKTLTVADAGKTFLVTADSTITLPATSAGVKFNFIANAARTTVEIVLSPAAADGIYGTTNASTNVVLSGADDADIKNTKGTQEVGDNISIMGDGVNGWFVVGCHGIWANV
jgi:hypothetical protein